MCVATTEHTSTVTTMIDHDDTLTDDDLERLEAETTEVRKRVLEDLAKDLR